MKKLRKISDFLQGKVEQLERMVLFMRDSNSEFQKLKEEYLEQKMQAEQVRKMQAEIDMARMEARRRKKRKLVQSFATTAAAMVLAFVALPNTSVNVAHAMEQIPLLGKLVEVVTFRNYDYEDERNLAKVEVPELGLGEVELGDGYVSEEVKESIKQTTEEINAEIARIADELVAEFEKNLQYKEGYQNIGVKSEVLCTMKDYFTLKLICYQASGSGMEWNVFYTIDLNTGERLSMSDLFEEGVDYITPISEDIKTQMRERMKADEKVFYWVDYTKVPGWNFQSITDKTSFYLNQDGKLVIGFNEGEVAPMYMGTEEFVISDEALEGLWKIEK